MTSETREPSRPGAGPHGSDPAGGSVRIEILGELAVLRDGVAIDVKPAMIRNLLAVLALHPGQAVSRDRIIAALWEDDPPTTSRNLIHGYVSRLRSQLRSDSGASDDPDAIVVWNRAGYRLNVDPDSVDLARFDLLYRKARLARHSGDVTLAIETYDEALRCWQGTLFEDLEPRFRRLPAAVAAVQRWLDAVAEQADLCSSCGRHTVAIEYLRRAIRVSPLHETLHARLMTALAASGDRALALETYTSLRQRLAEDLGVDPGNELHTVYLRVLREENDEPVRGAGQIGEAEQIGGAEPVRGAAPVGNGEPAGETAVPGPGSAGVGRRRLRLVGPPQIALGAGAVVCGLVVATLVASSSARPDHPGAEERAGLQAASAVAAQQQEYWYDFSSGGLDPNHWKSYKDQRANGASWSPGAVRVRDGELQIVGTGRNPTGRGNVAGGVGWLRKNAPVRQYGTWEVRARFEVGAGYGPIIGLFPYKGTEEDGYLTLARVDQGNRTSMYPELRGIGGKVITGAAVAGDFTAWATYSIEWRADFVVVSLNGAPIIDTRELADAVNIPTVPMYLYIQVVPGPDGPVPSVTPETPEEVVTHVDWVRYSA